MPDTYIRDGSQFRKAKEIHIHDSVAFRKAKQVYVHDGAEWRKVFQTFTPGFSAALSMSHSTEYDPQTSMRVALRLNTDGSVYGYAEEWPNYTLYTMTSPPTWGTPLVSGIGVSYYCKLVKNSGYDLDGGPALNTWHSLSELREWALYNAFSGAFIKSFSGTIYLNSQASDTGAISTSFTLYAEATDNEG